MFLIAELQQFKLLYILDDMQKTLLFIKADLLGKLLIFSYNF